MEINDGEELFKIIPEGWISLNNEMDITYLGDGNKPYDHVMYRMRWTAEIDSVYDQREVPIQEAMMIKWKGPDKYPGSPYHRKKYPQYFSDHKPIFFRVNIPERDDD
jgi:hypothetical protein